MIWLFNEVILSCTLSFFILHVLLVHFNWLLLILLGPKYTVGWRWQLLEEDGSENNPDWIPLTADERRLFFCLRWWIMAALFSHIICISWIVFFSFTSSASRLEFRYEQHVLSFVKLSFGCVTVELDREPISLPTFTWRYNERRGYFTCLVLLNWWLNRVAEVVTVTDFLPLRVDLQAVQIIKVLSVLPLTCAERLEL